MTAKRKIIIIILFAFIIIGIGFCILIQTPIGQRYFFKGNRITVNLKVFVDDKELSLDQLFATCKTYPMIPSVFLPIEFSFRRQWLIT